MCGRENPPEALSCTTCGSALRPEAQLREAAALPMGDRIPPRDLGALLSETIAVYWMSFWPFVGLALVPQLPTILGSFSSGLAGWFFTLVGLLLTILLSGASVYAVTQQYLDRAVDVVDSYRMAWKRALSLLLAHVLVGLALLGAGILILLIIGLPLFFYILVAWFFFAEAIMVERKRGIEPLGRSAELVRGSWWRVFGIGIVYFLILIGAFVVAAIPLLLASLAGPVVETIVSVAVATVVAPFLFIGRTLVYLDLRVRKEGYTLGDLASEMRSAATS